VNVVKYMISNYVIVGLTWRHDSMAPLMPD